MMVLDRTDKDKDIESNLFGHSWHTVGRVGMFTLYSHMSMLTSPFVIEACASPYAPIVWEACACDSSTT